MERQSPPLRIFLRGSTVGSAGRAGRALAPPHTARACSQTTLFSPCARPPLATPFVGGGGGGKIPPVAVDVEAKLSALWQERPIARRLQSEDDCGNDERASVSRSETSASRRLLRLHQPDRIRGTHALDEGASQARAEARRQRGLARDGANRARPS